VSRCDTNGFHETVGDWIRQGRGQYLVAGESVASSALNNLSDSIKEAKNSIGKGGDKPGSRQTVAECFRRLSSTK
jgi:hypothetical protein